MGPLHQPTRSTHRLKKLHRSAVVADKRPEVRVRDSETVCTLPKMDGTEIALGRSFRMTIVGVHTAAPDHPPFPPRYAPACSRVRYPRDTSVVSRFISRDHQVF